MSSVCVSVKVKCFSRGTCLSFKSFSFVGFEEKNDVANNSQDQEESDEDDEVDEKSVL